MTILFLSTRTMTLPNGIVRPHALKIKLRFDDTFSQLIQYTISGITSGSIYAAIGICRSVVYLITKVLNFTTGELLMLRCESPHYHQKGRQGRQRLLVHRGLLAECYGRPKVYEGKQAWA